MAAGKVRQTLSGLNRRMRSEPRMGELSVTKHGIPGQLYREGGKTPKALAVGEGVQPQSLTRVLAELEEAGYALRRQEESDRWQFRMELTASGRERRLEGLRSSGGAMGIEFTRLILYVDDVARLRSFYQTYFGFALVEEIADEWVVLEAGRVELALHRVGVAWRTSEPKGEFSNAKLVFTVGSGLVELRGRLLEAEVPMGEMKRYPGFAYLLCDGRDPEGNVFQLSQPDGESTAREFLKE